MHKNNTIELNKQEVASITKKVVKLLGKLQKMETRELVVSSELEDTVDLYRLLVFLHGSSIEVAEKLQPAIAEGFVWSE